jgi:ribosomal protein S18 acetylase RimI-like enzyme
VTLAEIRAEDWSMQLADELEDRIYEFNAAATGIADGRGLALVVRDSAGRVVAAALGHTWGGTCYLKQVWVDEPLRRAGLGRALLFRAITEAEARSCAQLLLETHSFQAPRFYERLGFCALYQLNDYPRGHAQILMRRELTPKR